MNNTENEYQDKTPVTLDKKDLNRICWRSFLLNTSFNYERMQAGGVSFALMPALRKIHKNDADLKIALKTHMEFFNTNTFVPTFPFGLALAAESEKKDVETIRSLKLAAMAPLAGIGDSLLWATGIPIIGGIAASLASQGNVIAPFFYVLVFFILQCTIRFSLMRTGYNQGLKAITGMASVTAALTRAATILGMTVIGGLMASYVKLSTPLVIHAGDATVKVQADLLDAIMPNLLPLAFTGLVFYLIKYRGWKPLNLIGLTTVLSLIGSAIGIL